MRGLRKILPALACVLMLNGCAKISAGIQPRLDAACAEAVSHPLSSANNRKKYYSYYLEPSIGRITSTETGNEFLIGSERFVMNLDVAAIINEKYYPEETVSHDLALSGTVIASASSSLICADGSEMPYSVVIEKTGEDDCLIHVTAGYMSFEGFASQASAPAVAGEMLKISRSVIVDKQEVLAAFTTMEGIDYVGTPVELFEDKAPENGSIEELLVDYDGRPRSTQEAETSEEERPPEEEAGAEDAAE